MAHLSSLVTPRSSGSLAYLAPSYSSLEGSHFYCFVRSTIPLPCARASSQASQAPAPFRLANVSPLDQLDSQQSSAHPQGRSSLSALVFVQMCVSFGPPASLRLGLSKLFRRLEFVLILRCRCVLCLLQLRPQSLPFSSSNSKQQFVFVFRALHQKRKEKQNTGECLESGGQPIETNGRNDVFRLPHTHWVDGFQPTVCTQLESIKSKASQPDVQPAGF